MSKFLQDWSEATLEDLVTFQRGYDITKAQQREGPYPVISSSGIKSYHAEYKFEGPGVIIGRKGSLGTVFFVADRYWPHDTTLWVKDFHGNDPRFCYYFLKGMGFQQYDVGAANPTLNRNHIHGLPVLLPSLTLQKLIASILSAYDDLIENNTRRIAILEEMARRLYEEWFVHFRFPGHNETEFEKKPISDVAEVVRGRSYKSSELVTEGGRPFVNLKCVNREGGFRRDGLKRYDGRFKDQQLVSSGDIIMAVTDMTQERRIVARAALVPELGDVDGLISMDLVKIVPKSPTTGVFLYAALRWSDFAENVKNHATGANVLHLHPDRISEYLMPLPPVEYQQRYASMAVPIIDEIELLEQKSANLRAQRDLLLPKLVSGEIDVSEAESTMEAAE